MGWKKPIQINKNYSTSEPNSTMSQEQQDKLINEFLAKGGKIQKIPPKHIKVRRATR
jgi:hypothetical protein|tara:strand:- start:723 stop:893 length:171 start_codon:yes stop_codon:yes gene_type:complete